MSALSDPARPMWLRVVQFPLVRLVVLGAVIFYMLARNNGFMVQFHDRPLIAIAVTVAMALLGLLIYWGYGRLVERREVSELSLRGALPEWAVGAAMGVLLYTACVGVLMILGMYRIDGLNAWTFLIPAIAMALSSGVFEELLFRGVLFKSVEDLLGSWAAIAVSSGFFGFSHLLNPGGTIVGAIYITIEAGLLLAAAFMVTRRLWICMGFHMGWNYVQSAVFSGVVSGGVTDPGLIQQTIEGPDVLTGGAFGLESSVIAFLFCTAAGVAMLRVAVRRGHVVGFGWR